MATKDKSIRRGIELYIDGKKVRADFRMIQQEVNRLTREIRTMTIGSEEYNRTADKIKRYNIILRQHRQELRGVEQQQRSWLSKGTQLFKDYSLQIMGTGAAITNVTMKLNEFRRQAAEKEDAAANLKALTGLDDNNIQWLTQQAETLSTTMEASGLRVRQSATEILEAYMLVGSKKPELLRDKEALNAVTIEAMRLAEAAKMDLKDAVEGVTLAMNQYGASANEASRYVNVLAAGSKYGAVGVATQTESIVKSGVAASTAKVPIEQLVGVLETLGEKGIEGARAGTQLKTFLLKLESGAKDTRPSVVGLQTALERLAAKNLDATQMTKLFGLECYTAAQALISSADKVKYYTDAVTGTNVAVEQAAINSDTTAAKMAQVRNQINLTGQELAKTLAPIMSKTVGWTRRFVMAMPAMIDFLKKWGVQLAVLAVAYNALTIKTAVATAAQASWNATVNFAKGLAGGFRAILLLLHAGYTLLTKGITAAKVEMTALNAAMKANAFGILVTLGVALYEIISRLVNRTKDLTKEQRLQRDMARDISDAEKQGNAERAKSETKIRQLTAVVHDNNRSLKDRSIALAELKAIVPGYHAQLTTEGKLIKDNTVALKEYLDNLKQVAVQQALQEKMTKLVNAELDKQDSRNRRNHGLRVRRDRLSAFDAEHADIKDFLDKGYSFGYGGGYEFVSKWMKEHNIGSRLRAQSQIGSIIKQRQELVNSINEAEGWVKEVDDDIDNLQKRQQNLQKQGYDIIKTLPDVDNPNPTPDTPLPTNTTTPEKESEEKKRIRLALEKIDAEYNKRAADLKQQYINGEIKTEREYSTKLQQIEISRFKDKADVLGLDEKQQSEFLERVKDIQLEALKYINEQTKVSAKDTTEARLAALQEEYEASKKYIEDAYQNGIIPTEERYKEYLLALERNYNLKKKELQEKEASDNLKRLEEEHTKELNLLRLKKAQGLIKEDDYEKEVIRLKQEYAQKKLQVVNMSNEDQARVNKEAGDAELEAEEKRNEERKKLAAEREKIIRETAQSIANSFTEFGEMLGEWMTGEEADFKSFLKNLLVTLLDGVQKAITAQYAAILAGDIATKSWGGIASAAAKMAIINAAFGVAKALITSSFDTGGFTPDGAWNQPQGIVHSNEFVANRHAVANPQVLPVLKLIDAAQRTGSIANLTGQQIASVATGSAPASPSVQSAHNHITQSARDPELTAAIHLLVRTATQATEAYKKPVRAYTFADGRGGVNEAQALLEKMLDNASRKS